MTGALRCWLAAATCTAYIWLIWLLKLKHHHLPCALSLPIQFHCEDLRRWSSEFCFKYCCFVWTSHDSRVELALINVQVLVVRQDLKMGAGKIASQCARKFISKWTHAVYLVHIFFFALSIGFCTPLKKMYNLCDCLICNRQILARAALNFCYMYWTFEPTYTSFVANLLQMQRLACTQSCCQGVNAVCTVSSLGSFSWRMSDVYFSLHRHKYSFIMLLYTM